MREREGGREGEREREGGREGERDVVKQLLSMSHTYSGQIGCKLIDGFLHGSDLVQYVRRQFRLLTKLSYMHAKQARISTAAKTGTQLIA